MTLTDHLQETVSLANENFLAGYREGKDVGHREGYAEGYAKAMADAREIVDKVFSKPEVPHAPV